MPGTQAKALRCVCLEGSAARGGPALASRKCRRVARSARTDSREQVGPQSWGRTLRFIPRASL